jgi:hypothetical protein
VCLAVRDGVNATGTRSASGGALFDPLELGSPTTSMVHDRGTSGVACDTTARFELVVRKRITVTFRTSTISLRP